MCHILLGIAEVLAEVFLLHGYLEICRIIGLVHGLARIPSGLFDLLDVALLLELL